MDITETLLATLLGGAIGFLGYVVGKYQARTDRLRLRHELYDRRMKLFGATMGFIAHIIREAKVEETQLFEFNRATNESFFLFGKDIQEYLREIYEKAVDLHGLNTKLHRSELPVGDERTAAAKENGELLKWFGKQFEVARVKFAKHMSLVE